MNDDEVLSKTAAGHEALRTRSPALPSRLRPILIMVDGVRRVRELRQAAATIGAPPDALQTLLDMGLMAPVRAAAGAAQSAAPVAAPGAAPLAAPGARAAPSAPMPLADAPVLPTLTDTAVTPLERFRVAKKFMNDTIVDALGIRAFMFTLKLEKCAVLADLAELMPEYVRLVTKARGQQVAGALETRLRELVR